MPMSLFPLRILGTFPSMDSYRKIIEEFAELGSGKVCILESGLSNRIHELLEAHPNLSTSNPAEIAGVRLVLTNQPSPPIADSKQVAEFVRSVLLSAENLGPFDSVRGYGGVQRKLHSAMCELRQWRIGAEQLRKSDSRLDSVSVEKFLALADLEESVRHSIENAHLELEESKLERIMVAELSKSAELNRILVFASGHLEPLIIDWLRWCQENGSIVWIVTPFHSHLPLSWTGSQNLAASCNSPIEQVGELPELVADFCRVSKKSSSNLSVQIESSTDEMAESEWALRRVQSDLKSGLKPAQIGIFVRNLRFYAPFLSAASLRLGVPLSLAQNVELLTSQFAIWVLALLRTLAHRNLRLLLEVIASPYSNLHVEELSGVKGIIFDSMRIRGGEWERLNEQLEILPEWIQVALLWQRVSETRIENLKEWNQAFVEFLQIEPIKKLAEQQDSGGKRDQIALEEMRKSFARHVFADANTSSLSFPKFVKELDEVWELASIDIGTHSGGVEVCDSPLALLGKDCIHALGLLEGMFPRRRTEDPILSDWERSILVDTSLPNALLNSHSIAAQEAELFLCLLGAANKQLTLSYPTTSEDRDNVPAYYLTELSNSLGEKAQKSHRLQGVWAPEANDCLCEADISLRRAIDSPMISFSNELVEDETSLVALRTIPEERHSIFDLRSASGCAFRSASQRKLNLRRNVGEKRLRRLPNVESLPKHSDSESARKALILAWNQHLEDVESETSPEAVAMASSSAKRNIDRSIEAEFIARELWPKQPGQTELDVDFASDSLVGEIKLSADDKLRLSGRIPAVSKMGPYRVAHVFHARKALFNSIEKWGDEERLEVGLYFAALGNSTPGAAIEFSADDGERLLVCNEIIPGSQPKSQPNDGLKAVSVNARETKFLSQAGEIVKKAVLNSRSHSMEVAPGDQCTFCDFGELCRRSKEFGEQSDLMEGNE